MPSLTPMTHQERVAKGIAHIKGFGRPEWIEDSLNHLARGTGSRRGCIGNIKSHTNASAYLAWFAERDLASFKQWAYVSGKLERMIFQLAPRQWFPSYFLLMPVLSDHEALVQWFAHNDLPFDIARAENHRTPDFHCYQALLALRGEWTRLAERCTRILADPPNSQKKYLIDHRFFLALAHGDKAGMETVLAELTAPKAARWRNDERGFGFQQHFIATHAVIYAKIAWRHGYKIAVDTPYVPPEWLSVAPLPAYRDPYPFMAEFAIDTPPPNRGAARP